MRTEQPADGSVKSAEQSSAPNLIPSISLPKGGGAIRGMGEKFGANPVTGTGSMALPIFASASRFGPTLGLSYDSGAGNGPFGLGWTLSAPSVTRKTDKGLPRYADTLESDVFLLSDAEDLVPALVPSGGDWIRDSSFSQLEGAAYTVQRYRPRIEGLFARIERWTDATGRCFWKTISRDNVTSLFGLDSDGRIFDPEDPSRIFKWLLQRSYDDKGNVAIYEYAIENRDGVPAVVHESNRQVGAQRYLKHVRYGNRTPYYPDLQPQASLPAEWFFHLVFDYGEHDLARPRIDKDVTWPARPDPFSSYRAGFEVRSHRLCRRILMFHHFAELGATPCLVGSTDFSYDLRPIATVLASARHTSYRRNPLDQSYSIIDPATNEALSPRSMPPLELTYSEAKIDETLRVVDGDALENLPYGVDGTHYQWLDLDGEGSPGILTEQAEGWFYKRNVSNLRLRQDDQVRAAFEPVQCVASRPSLAALGGGHQQFVDLAGEGRQCLVQFSQPVSGFHAQDGDGWLPFTPFADSPEIDWSDPNLRTLDLDGDGLADVLISQDEVFTWYASRGKDGFAPAEWVRKPLDDTDGPALVFADATQSIFLADFSGDGLTDIVRIRNGEVCYWPNTGYGRFGAKVEMSNAPWFDAPDQFDPKRIRLADIDGSGTTDIIYLGRREVVLHFNQSGNAWADPRALAQFPAPDQIASVAAVDLLGNGTACLVWSSPLPGEAARQLRYVDLMGGQKPHLLVAMKNNLGAETRVHYVASTRFYLQDRLAGTPWVTKLPFPVHVVERVEVRDQLSKTRFVSRFAYHHGYFDGVEREFRGFGLVEQWDSEAFAAFTDDPAVNIDQATALPPILTRTWFHTGARVPGGVSSQFKDHYYREPGLGQAASDAMLLPDTILPVGITSPDGKVQPWPLSADEEREACRSLKGATLRQEIYALDGSLREGQPYSVSERNFTIKMLQPAGQNRHSVFFTHDRETIDYHYERTLYDVGGQSLADPRVTHAMTLAVDAYGNVLQSAAVGYGRRHDATDPALTADDKARQTKILATLSESRVSNPIVGANQYRTPLVAENRTYELLKVAPQAHLPLITNLIRFDEMVGLVQIAGDGLHDIPCEDVEAKSAQGNGPYRRLLKHARTLYRKDDLSGPLPLGVIEPLALPYERYQLSFTPGLLSLLGARISPADATSLLTGVEGRYRDLDGDGRLWIPSGRVFVSPDPANPDPTFARNHRYLPQGAQDQFGNVSRLVYDGYELVVAQTADARGNTVSAEYDYRVLQPGKVTDPNGNQTAVAFDVFGLVAGTAVMGKALEPDGKPKGDSLQGFAADLTDTQVKAFFGDPRGQAAALLGSASSRVVYDVGRFLEAGAPAFSAAVVRETHVADLQPGQQSKLQVTFSHSDGFGREIQKKIPAEPGPVDSGGPSVDPRWVGSGWTIFNNKGKPVRQYEPFFTATHHFEFGVERGVSPTLFYDPAARVVATLHADHTYEKARFDPWSQESWDANDTVTLDPIADPDVAAWFARLNPVDYLPSWYGLRADPANAAQAAQRWPDPALRAAESEAAKKAAAHAGTPTVAHLDSQGGTFLTLADNGAAGKYATRVRSDVEGNKRSLMDALGRPVMAFDYNLQGAKIHQISMEAGERWMLSNASGKAIRAWDTRGHLFRTEYDELLRPLNAFVLGADPKDPTREILFAKTEYGEGQPDDAALNLRTRVYRQYDGAGVVTHRAFNPATGQEEGYDFKGNSLRSSRQFVLDHRSSPDWSGSPALDGSFTGSSSYDALNRAISHCTPEGSTIRPAYNEANRLEQISLELRGAATATAFVTRVDYDASGKRLLIGYGNGVESRYEYDPANRRLTRSTTTRPGFPVDQQSVQDLSYAFDAAGNVTHIRDNADLQDVIYFNNQRVDPSADYLYDAVYRLIQASGREHLGLSGGQANAPTRSSYDDAFHSNLPHPSDGLAMGTYVESYVYDAVGNIQQMKHRGASPANPGWTRFYAYDEASLIEPGANNNRLSSTTVGQSVESCFYDAPDGLHGNITRMPQLQAMAWDFKDQLRMSQRQAVSAEDAEGIAHQGERTYYVYDSGGERVRKVTERQNGTRKDERLYLGGCEVYREYDGTGGSVVLERESLHVMDGGHRVALVETKTRDQGSAVAAPAPVIRYQFENHLGSASLELDDQGAVITYEEYFPFGGTSYQAGRSKAEVSLKRYRHTGKERDGETGLYYHGARYYAAWLGRWISGDPAQLVDGLNAYTYGRNAPTRFSDPNGLWGHDMHFGAVYLAGRLAGASHEQALQVAIASEALDDYRNLAAPPVKARTIGMRLTQYGKPAEAILDHFHLPTAEFPAALVPDFARRALFPYSHPSLTFESAAKSEILQLNYANNAHSLGVTREESQQVAKLGIKKGNLTLFGLGLHAAGDFLSHANTTGWPSVGHQFGTNEDGTSSDPISHSADHTWQNPRKALATLMDFVKLWGEFLGPNAKPVTFSDSELRYLDTFLKSSDDGVKEHALEMILQGRAKTYEDLANIADFKKFSKIEGGEGARNRRIEFEKIAATCGGSAALGDALGVWLSRRNDTMWSILQIDTSQYTDDPNLPPVGYLHKAKVTHYRPGQLGGHRNP